MRFGSFHPIGHMGEIADIVGADRYLETAPFVTGEILHVDGGQRRRPLKQRSFALPPNARWRSARHARPGHNQVTREGTRPGASSVTAEEKAALIMGASQLLLDVLNKPLDATYV